MKRLVLAAILCVSAVGLFAQPNDSPAKNKSDATQVTPAPTSPDSNRKLADKTYTAKSGPPRWYTSSEWWLVIIAALTGFAISYQAREMVKTTKVIKRQAELMKRQTIILVEYNKATRDAADAAAKSAAATERTVELSVNKDRPLLLIEGNITSEFEAAFTATNKGRSPARITYCFVGCEIFDSEEDFAKKTPDYTSGDPEWVFARNDWLLPDKSIDVGDYSADYISKSENPELFEEIMSGKSYVWYYGIVRYIESLTEDMCDIRFCYKCWPSENGKHWLSEGGPEAYLGENRQKAKKAN